MSYSVSDFRELAKKQQEEKAKTNEPALYMLERAAVDAKMLTGSPYWDKYLTQLQASIEGSERQREEIEARLCSPDTVNNEEIMRLKIVLAEVRGRIEAWTAALRLPTEIIDADLRAKA
jgi:hypothetical protein